MIETLAQPSTRTVSANLPAEGFVQLDRVQITVPVAFGVAAAASPRPSPLKTALAAGVADPPPAARVTVQVHDESNPPPAALQLGTIEVHFVIAAKR